MTRKLFLISACLLLGLFSSCFSRESYLTFGGGIYGTEYRVVYEGHEELVHDEIKAEVERILERIDHVASGWKEDSEISRYNRAKMKPVLSPELEALLSLAEEMKQFTGGAFDVNFSGAGIDLSAIAKGYAVDCVADYLREELQVENFLVEIGGEIKAQGGNIKGQPWQLGIYLPPSIQGKPPLAVTLENTSIATSGQYFKENHIKDAATQRAPENDLVSCSVIHPSNATADALATALLVMGAEKGIAWADTHQVKALVVKRDGTVLRSKRW